MPGGYAADWPTPPGVRTWQTTRSEGASRGAYAGLNLALHVGDDQAAVIANRASLVEALGLPGEPNWLEQVHGRRVLDFDRNETGAADAAVTSRSGCVLAVMTADCLPVLLATRSGDRIAVVHAGWRGLAAGVIGQAVAACGAAPGSLQAWLGPAITQSAFEVGDEVRQAFVGPDPDAADAFRQNDRGRWQADLYALARRSLVQAGVDEIYGRPSCTFEDSEQFFSHRREAPCGRMATLIWRDQGRE